MLPLVLHWVNVVILAKSHNPSILNPDFLRINDIVSSDWEANEILTTPAFATVRYPAGVVFLLDQERLEIRKECAASFQDNYDVHNFAVRYAKVLPHVSYTSVGLNWHISAEMAEPGMFITDRFVRPEAWKESGAKPMQSSVKLSFKMKDTLCNLNFSPGKAKIPGREYYPAVIINANYHYDGPFTPEQIETIMKEWKNREKCLVQIIPILLGEHN
ncbi:MAG: hypothetical protein FJ128_12830 [Deltaproteobacteria bacterium]|nr:hypothetical protein [Deltaproteobacteria bacterium]MBM4286109.1 hypothetical protein [Deltaproteobacteria bacterium]